MAATNLYHVNPNTGNVNRCGAKYRCQFHPESTRTNGDIPDDRHYASKEDAQRGAEVMLEAATMDVPRAITRLTQKLPREQGVSWDRVGHHLEKVAEAGEGEWDQDARENLHRVETIADIVGKSRVTAAQWAEVEEAINHLHLRKNLPHNQRYLDLNRNLASLGASLALRRRNWDAPQVTAPPRERNGMLLGVDAAGESALLNLNEPLRHSPNAQDHYIAISPDAQSHLEESLDRLAAGEKLPDLATPGIRRILDYEVDDRSLLRPRDRIVGSVNGETGEGSQFYLAAAFPDNELRVAMARNNTGPVSVAPFYNTREWGNAYTAIQPDGTSRTFSVYEHRNTDSIIINGRENWVGGEASSLPYAGESKYDFFAEFPPGEYRQAADALSYFLKSAQKGDLESDQDLVAKCSRRDWKAILSDSIPGYGEWHENRFGPDTTPPGDEGILRRLEFPFSDPSGH